jgi:hypothetical protein
MVALAESGVRLPAIIHEDGTVERWKKPRLADWENHGLIRARRESRRHLRRESSDSRTQARYAIAQNARLTIERKCNSGMTSTGPPARRLSSDFTSLNDFRKKALAEVQIGPDDSGLVTVWRIEQINGPLGQRVPWQ